MLRAVPAAQGVMDVGGSKAAQQGPSPFQPERVALQGRYGLG